MTAPGAVAGRCQSVHDGLQCGLDAGHSRDHTALIPTDARWKRMLDAQHERVAACPSRATIRPTDEPWPGCTCGLSTPAPEIRREWRVWVTGPNGAKCLWASSDDDAHADDVVARLHRRYPDPTVEIEEREIITRVVSRRVVPRPEGGA